MATESDTDYGLGRRAGDCASWAHDGLFGIDLAGDLEGDGHMQGNRFGPGLHRRLRRPWDRRGRQWHPRPAPNGGRTLDYRHDLRPHLRARSHEQPRGPMPLYRTPWRAPPQHCRHRLQGSPAAGRRQATLLLTPDPRRR